MSYEKVGAAHTHLGNLVLCLYRIFDKFVTSSISVILLFFSVQEQTSVGRGGYWKLGGGKSIPPLWTRTLEGKLVVEDEDETGEQIHLSWSEW